MIDYNDVNMERVKKRLKYFSADMGGTEIFEPLKDIFN